MSALLALAGAGYTGRADRIICAALIALVASWVLVSAFLDWRAERELELERLEDTRR